MSQGWCRSCINTWAKARNKELRMEALVAYGHGDPYCRCCGDNRFEFLCLDHINGGGNKHRIEISGSKNGGNQLYYWLKRNKYPDGFQVLCHNCNMAKHIYGKCPYEKSHVWPNTTRKVV